MTMLSYENDMGVVANRDTANFTEAQIDAILDEGWGHYFGNRVASQAVGRIKQDLAKARGMKAAEISGADVSAWRKANPDATSAIYVEFANAALEKLDAGEIPFERQPGKGSSVERLTPLERMCRNIAELELTAKLSQFPHPDDPSKTLGFPKGKTTINFGGQDYTGVGLVKFWLSAPKRRERIETQAKRELARLEDAAAKAAQATAGQSLEQLLEAE